MQVLYDETEKPDKSPQDEFLNYKRFARTLFGADSAEQQYVPFLGAGASLHFARRPPPPKLSEPEQESIDLLCTSLSLTSPTARDLVELAVRVAKHMETTQASEPGPEPGNAPSSGTLASALASEIGYRHLARAVESLQDRLPRSYPDLEAIFRAVISITGVCSSAPPLLSVASYYQYRENDEGLWSALQPIFEKVNRPTETHKLIAEIAYRHIHHEKNGDLRRQQRNYLAITTNYDNLIEMAMTSAEVPHCMITVPKQGDRVRVRFSGNAAEYFGYSEKQMEQLRLECEEPRRPGVKARPEDFTLEAPKPVAIVYKIHGCLSPSEKEHNGVVISDEDYIDNLSRNGITAHLVPNSIKSQLAYSSFLFLGYSFSDWNVRSLFKSARGIRHSAPQQDYAVLLNWYPYESKFFDKYNITIAAVSLDTFASGIRNARP